MIRSDTCRTKSILDDIFFLLTALPCISSCDYLFVLSTFTIKMPKGYEFSQDTKEIFFNVIQFVERLKSEMREIEHDMMEKKRNMDEEKEELKNQKLQVLSRLRNLRSRSSSSSSTSSIITTNAIEISVPVPRSPQKLSNSGCSSIVLTEQQQETIR